MTVLVDSGNKKNPYYNPVRVIMNNSTLSIFKSDTFENIYLSVNLEGLELLKKTISENCLSLKDKSLDKITTICAIANKHES
jgi:hypothetical protein